MGRTYVVPFAKQTSGLPCIAAFEPSGAVVTGESAAKQQLTNPKYTFASFYRLLNLPAASRRTRHLTARLTYELFPDKFGQLAVRTPQEAVWPLAKFLDTLLQEVIRASDAFAQMPVRNAVLTIPSRSNLNLRQDLTSAARAVGLNVIDIIEKPVAAALAYGEQGEMARRVLVADIGAGSTEIAVIQRVERELHVLHTMSDSSLGGDDFDQRIYDWILEECQQQKGFSSTLDAASRRRIEIEAESAKSELSVRNSKAIKIPFLSFGRTGPFHYEGTITRALLEKITSDLVARILQHCQQALSEAHILPKFLDAFLIAGGQSRMPMISGRITKVLRLEPLQIRRPEDAAAIGAAIFGDQLIGTKKGWPIVYPVVMQLDRFQPGQLIEDRFQVVNLVGSGAFSYIYKVLDRRNGEEVAIKILRLQYNAEEEILSRFVTTAQRVMGLRHPNIVRTDEIIRGNQMNLIRMEFIDGVTLQEFISSGRFARLSLRDRFRIFTDIISALIMLRGNGMYHGDLKPENILLTRDLHPKLFDFELARYGTAIAEAAKRVTGTPRYMSPEHMGPPETFGDWSEIYSMGLMLYEAFTGAFPRKENEPEQEYVTFDITSLSSSRPLHPCLVNTSLSKELGELIMKAINRKRTQRQQTFEELLDELRRLPID